ncbi:MAG: sugar ABC transporter permease [Dehalococcoidales bacterium]|nr:sugar ABC transporter permease [Dehalococcoidales bacterium]
MTTLPTWETSRRGRSRAARRRLGPDALGYLMIAPAYTIYVVFILFPVALVALLSLTDYSLVTRTWHQFGLENYVDLVANATIARALNNSIVYAVFTVLPGLVVGFLLAWILNGPIWGLALFRQVYYYPNVISFVAASVTWVWIYDPTMGFLNRVLELLGLPVQEWLYDPNLALPAVIVLGIWKSLGFNMVIYLAALQSIPRELYEAARVDGARNRDCLLRIAVPLVQPTTFFLVIMGLIAGFQAFDQIYVMTGGGPAGSTTTLVHQMYLNIFFYQRLGLAGAISMLVMVAVAAIALVNFRYANQGQLEGL